MSPGMLFDEGSVGNDGLSRVATPTTHALAAFPQKQKSSDSGHSLARGAAPTTPSAGGAVAVSGMAGRRVLKRAVVWEERAFRWAAVVRHGCFL